MWRFDWSVLIDSRIHMNTTLALDVQRAYPFVTVICVYQRGGIKWFYFFYLNNFSVTSLTWYSVGNLLALEFKRTSRTSCAPVLEIKTRHVHNDSNLSTVIRPCKSKLVEFRKPRARSSNCYLHTVSREAKPGESRCLYDWTQIKIREPRQRQVKPPTKGTNELTVVMFTFDMWN